MVYDSEYVPNVYGVLLIVADDNEVDFRFARLTSGLIEQNRLRGEDNFSVRTCYRSMTRTYE